MKKLLLLAFICTSVQVNYSQEDLCAKTAFNDLSNCLADNDVTFNYTYNGNTIYISALGDPPPGQVQSCIAQYNSQTNDCPDAPVAVNSTTNTSYNAPGKPN